MDRQDTHRYISILRITTLKYMNSSYSPTVFVNGKTSNNSNNPLTAILKLGVTVFFSVVRMVSQRPRSRICFKKRIDYMQLHMQICVNSMKNSARHCLPGDRSSMKAMKIGKQNAPHF